MKSSEKTTAACQKKLSVVQASNKLEYEKDFFKWTKTQAKILKKLEFEKLDIEHLIEEIESLGKSEKRALKSYLEVLLTHMLKYLYQPDFRSRSWELSIKHSRNKFKEVLSDNPSLKSQLESIILSAYKDARLKAALETQLPENTFPEECPWGKKQISDEKFFGV